jgi:hypothetical protein
MVQQPARSRKSPPTDCLRDDDWREELVRCAWMALGGRTQDLARYLGRLLPRLDASHPKLAAELRPLLRSQPSAGSILRSAPTLGDPWRARGTDPVSLETPSGGELLRVEEEIVLPFEPIWSQPVKQVLDALLSERKASHLLLAQGLAPSRSALFTGAPGVGKTLAARWLARELGLPLATLNLGAVMSSYLGRSGANLRSVLAYGAARPCILFLDEFDAIAKRRDDVGDVGELKRLVTVLLQEIDGWPSQGLLIAATNHPDLLDPAVWRRFDHHIAFPLLDRSSREQFFRQLIGESWDSISAPIRAALIAAAAVKAPSDLTQLTLRARRDSVLGGAPLNERLAYHLRIAFDGLPLHDRRKVGADLRAAGVGQREINRLTGLARETIRAINA